MKFKLIIPILIMIFLCSCARVIDDAVDEIRMNRWSAKLQNGSVASLSFNDDYASFKIQSKDKAACAAIKGLGIIDDKTIFIYNLSDNEPYYFDYIIKNNTLIIKYNGGKLTLYHKN